MIEHNDPLVSVIISVYNGEQHVAESIKSVINQNYQSTEIIVVDDGPTDGGREIIQRYVSLVRYHYQPNSGIVAAWNQGIELTKRDFIAFNGADDLSCSFRG